MVFKKFSFRFSRWLWAGLILAGLATILAAFGYWYINRPEFYAFVQEKIRREWGIEVRWRSLQWSLWGWLKIVEPEVDYPLETVPFHIAADSMQVSDLFSGKPDVELSNLCVSSGTARIGTASRVYWHWGKEAQPPRARIGIERVWADASSIASIQSATRESGESRQLDLSWLDSFMVTHARIDDPSRAISLKGKGMARMNPEDGSLQLQANFYPQDELDTSHLSLQGSINPSEFKVNALRLVASRFPLAATGPYVFSLIADGTVEACEMPTGNMKVWSDLLFNQSRIQSPRGESIVLPTSSLRGETELSPRGELEWATGEIEHSSFTMHDSTQKRYLLPDGAVAVQYRPRNRELAIDVKGRASALDEYAVRVYEYPLSASSVWNAEIRLENRDIQTWLSTLPIDVDGFPMAGRIGGLLSLNGTVAGRGMEIDEIKAVAQWHDGRIVWDYGRIEDASIRMDVMGDGKIVRMEADGNAKVGYPVSGTKTISFEPAFRMNGYWNRQRGDYQISIPDADLGIVQSVSGWYKSGKEWRMEGGIPLEESIAQFREALPEWGQALEGMGQIQLAVRGNDKNIHIQLNSPDWMVYSLSDEYSYGVQLREMVLEGDCPLGKFPAFRATLKASTPYLTYGARDIEWPGETLAVQVNLDEKRTLSAMANPPGGGAISLVGNFQKGSDIKITDVSLETFLLPLINRFALGKETDDTSAYRIEGSANAGFRIQSDGSSTRLGGNANLAIRSMIYPPVASFSMSNAMISVPIVFPLDYGAFSSQVFSVSAEKIAWEGAEYDKVAFSIPLNSPLLSLVDDYTFPVFGGTMQLTGVKINNWLSSGLEVDGVIRLRDIPLQAVNTLLPVVPSEGILSGEIQRVLYSGERIEFQGQIELALFGGTVRVRDLFLRNSFGGSKVLGFSADIERIDLEKLSAYFQYGKITGVISGHMRNIQMIVPPAGSGDWIMPDRLDVEIASDPTQEGIISRDALFKIVELSGKSDMDLSQLKISQFKYSQIGLRVLLDGIQLQLIGTLDDHLFIAPSRSMFANKIGIRLASSDRALDFLDFWNRLLAQTGR